MKVHFVKCCLLLLAKSSCIFHSETVLSFDDPYVETYLSPDGPGTKTNLSHDGQGTETHLSCDCPGTETDVSHDSPDTKTVKHACRLYPPFTVVVNTFHTLNLKLNSSTRRCV